MLRVLREKIPDHVHRALLQREIDLVHLLAEQSALSAQQGAIHSREHFIARIDARNHLFPRYGRHGARLLPHLRLRRRIGEIIRNRVRHALRRIAAGKTVYAVCDEVCRHAARDDERWRALYCGFTHDESRADALHGKQAKRALRVEAAEQRLVRYLS